MKLIQNFGSFYFDSPYVAKPVEHYSRQVHAFKISQTQDTTRTILPKKN